MDKTDHPLRIWRRKNGLTLLEAGDMLGVSYATVSRFERGLQGMELLNRDLLRRIVELTDGEVTEEQILSWEKAA